MGREAGEMVVYSDNSLWVMSWKSGPIYRGDLARSNNKLGGYL